MKPRIVTAISMAVLAMGASARAAVPSAAAEVVTGRVLLDEAPLPGVRVSDGVGFATTGPDGTYRLTLAPDATMPYRAARAISVCWPSGTWPAGPWWRTLANVAPGGQANFALRRQEQALPFVFLHVTDDHSNGTMYPVWGADVGTMTPTAKFVVNTGDLGYATAVNAEGMFTAVSVNARSLPIPMFFAPGNHDVVPGSPGDGPRKNPLAGLGAFTRYLGPPRWSFDYAGARFIGVDVSAAGTAWLQRDLADLAPGQRAFLFIHKREGFRGDRRITRVFAGHTHQAVQNPGLSIPLPLAGTPHGKAPDIALCRPVWLSNGTCAMGLVADSTFHAADRCAGCRFGEPAFHLPRCPLSGLDAHVRSLKKRRGPPATLGDPVVQAGHFTRLGNPAGSPAVEIDVQLGAPAGGRAWLRIGQIQPLEISYDGATLTAGGDPIPLALRPGETTVSLHLHVTKTALTLYANRLVTLTRPAAVDDPSQVTAGATDGPGFFKSLTVWGLR